MVCRITIRATSPDGDRYEAPVDEILEEAEEEQSDGPAEQWKEVARTIEKLDVSGVEVDRIIRSTFEKPSGKKIELVFAEAQAGVDPESITTEA